jgi:hypothetical protein
MASIDIFTKPKATTPTKQDNITPKQENMADIIELKNIIINKTKATEKRGNFELLNPTERFAGIIECLSDIRHIDKKGDMLSDMDLVDVRIIDGYDVRETEVNIEGKKYMTEESVYYSDEFFSLVLGKTVLKNKFKNFQEQLKTLVGKKFVIVGLGKTEKNYIDFYIDTYENAVKDGIVIIRNK